MFACNETKTDDTNSETVDTGEEVTEVGSTDEFICSQLSLDECPNYAECEVIVGSPIVSSTEGEECIESSQQEPKACVESGCSADPTVTVAHPPDSEQCWVFASGCLPDGWVVCSVFPPECE